MLNLFVLVLSLASTCTSALSINNRRVTTETTNNTTIIKQPQITMLKKKIIKAVIFDLDGTLLDTERLSDEAMLFSLFGESIYEGDTELLLPWELKRQILGLRWMEWAPLVLDYYDNKSMVPIDLYQGWETKLNELCLTVKACPGANSLVDSLYSMNVPMAIATSSQLAAVNKKKGNHLKMFEKIQVIVSGDDPAIQRGKPFPDIYLEASKRLGVRPEECLVFEDALSGVKAGNSAGCSVIAVPDPRMENFKEFDALANTRVSSLEFFSFNDWKWLS